MNAVSAPVRQWLQAEGFAVLALSFICYWKSGFSWWLFAALLLTPDISMFGYFLNAQAGAISYNLAHNYVLPLTLIALALVFHHNLALPYLFIWTAHIGLDRMLGYGLKYSTGFKATHLRTIHA